VRRRDFFAAAILQPSRRIFFAYHAAGDFIVFKNAIHLQLMAGAIFLGKNLATLDF
jgi:hypothetical protein